MNSTVRQNLLFIAAILLLIVGAGMACSTVLIVFLLPAKYASVARVVPAVMSQVELATEVEKIQSEAILSQVVTNLNLAKRWGEKYKEGELRLDMTRNLLKRDLRVRPARNALIIDIRIENDDPLEAAAIANGLAEAYRDSAFPAAGPKGTAKAQIIDTATPSIRPVRSAVPRTIAVGCGLGLLLAFAGVVLLMNRK